MTNSVRELIPALFLALGPTHSPTWTSSTQAGGVRTLDVHPQVRLAVNAHGDLFFEVKARVGDGWSQLAARFASSPSDGATLALLNGGVVPVRDRYYRVPYALLRDEFKFLSIAALFPEDTVDAEGWTHRVGTARLPIEQESLYRLAFWLTGDGERFRDLLTTNGLAEPGLDAGQTIRVPARLLLPAFRSSTRREDPPLQYGPCGGGQCATYRLRPGDTLSSSVVMRFTGRVDPADVDTMTARIARLSAIADPDRVPAGTPVRIPIDALSEEFLPPGDPRRVELEMTRLLASHYHATATSRLLEGVTIVLDPGHGGVDVGARHHGIWEDDTVYDIAVRLEQKLRQQTAARVRRTLTDRSQGAKPYDGRFTSIDRDEAVLTRPPLTPSDPDSRERAVHLRAYLAGSILREARRRGVDDERVVFLSLHADALHSAVRGAMIYVPGERFRRGRYGASGPAWRRYREVREKPFVSFDRPERLRSEGMSRQLADAILASFRRLGLPLHAEMPVRDHVIREGRTWLPAVLRANEVPIKLLLEVGNLANSEDASQLASPRYRDRIAEALLQALLSFYRG